MIEDIKKIISKNIDCFHLEILDESPNHGATQARFHISK